MTARDLTNGGRRPGRPLRATQDAVDEQLAKLRARQRDGVDEEPDADSSDA